MSGPIPQGIEVLVLKAAIDADFRQLLLERRTAAAASIGLELTAAEATMLAAVPAAQLEAVIARTSVPQAHRRAFLGQAAAAMLAAVGMMTSLGCEPAWTPMKPGGSRPDLPPGGSRPDRVPPSQGTPPDRSPTPPAKEKTGEGLVIEGTDNQTDAPTHSVSGGIRLDRHALKDKTPAAKPKEQPPATWGIRPDRPPTATPSDSHPQ